MSLYVVTIQITAVAADAEPAFERYRAHLGRLEAEGRLRMAGAFARHDGTLEIFEACDRHEAEATVRSHPLVEAGVGAWSLRELLPSYGLGD